jgi:hypothetical protein
LHEREEAEVFFVRKIPVALPASAEALTRRPD